MAKTLLQMVVAAFDELGLNRPTVVGANPDPTIRQAVALLNRSGDELFQDHPWTVSQNQHIVNIAAPISTTGDLTATSTTITNIPDTSGIVDATAWTVTGDGVLVAARVLEVLDANTVRMDEPATVTQAGAEIVFARDTYAIPDDFSWFLNRTMWDRTNQWELIGPISPQMDQWQRSGVVTTGPRRRWRQVGLPNNCWRLWPPPTASSDYPGTLVFEYESKYWARAADGTPKASLEIDTDYPVISDQALILALKWRIWQIKGFSYAALQSEYVDYVSRLAARDGGSPDLTLSRRNLWPYLLGAENVQDGNFPGNS